MKMKGEESGNESETMKCEKLAENQMKWRQKKKEENGESIEIKRNGESGGES